MVFLMEAISSFSFYRVMFIENTTKKYRKNGYSYCIINEF